MTLEQVDLIAGWASFALTLMVFSYVLADNFLYRIAVHVLVGAAAVYVAIAALEEVIVPWVNLTLIDPASEDGGIRILGVMPFVIGIFLLFKSITRYAPLGNLGTSLLIGVGTGVALVGVVLSTLFPTLEAAGNSFQHEDGLNGFILLAGTICTLLYFQYVGTRRADNTVQRPLPLRAISTLGQGFIAITLGTLYAGAILTSLTIFSAIVNEQIRFILDQLGG